MRRAEDAARSHAPHYTAGGCSGSEAEERATPKRLGGGGSGGACPCFLNA